MANALTSNPLLAPVLFRLLPLLFLLLATRVDHFGSALHLPDASTTVFFVAGFLFAGFAGRMAAAGFGALIVAVVAIDFIGFALSGRETALCLSPSYPALLPAYGALWLGGRWLARRHTSGGAFALAALAAWSVAASLSFAIANGAFYWFSGRYAEPHLAEYLARFGQYYGPSLLSALPWLALAALVLLAARRAGLMRAVPQ